jgi:SAM-dependent methyltransferase
MVFQPYDPAATMRWYDDHSDRYDEETFTQDDDRYGGDLYRIMLVRQLLAEHRPKRLLDVGCGTAEPMLRLLQDGFDVRGFDFSSGMIAEAKRKLKARGYAEELAEVDDLLDPGIVTRYGEEGYDAVIANGVLPYIPAREEPHRHLAALLKPGGLYVSAYSNALFDLVTFNRFTIRFHTEKFLQGLGLRDEDRAELEKRLAGLVSNPDEPASIVQGARDHVFVRSDVPFEVSADLAKLGLRQIDILFYKFHAFPPLLKNASPALRTSFVRASRAYEIERARDWRGYFLASTFIMVCRKEV